MRRIVWVHNYSYPEYVGGAELTDFYWIKKGKKLGLNILEVKWDSKNIPSGDLYILGNTGKFNQEELQEKIADKPYACIVHGGIVSPETLEVYNRAMVLVFMSPEQKRRFGNLKSDQESLIIPPYIDTTKFLDQKIQRIPDSRLFVGAIREHKGIQTILTHAKKHPTSIYHFYGPTKDREIYLLDMIKKLPNCIYHGVAQNENLPEIMNKYETFVWFLNPDIKDFESFGRTIIEALLCGMKLEVNKRQFGAFSWDWNFNNPKEVVAKLEKYYSKFWSQILKVVRTSPS